MNVAWSDTVSENLIVLGLPFAQTFVTKFDYEANEMLFSQSVNALAGAKIVGPPKPDDPGMSGGDKFGVVVLIFGILAVTLVVSILVYRCMSKKGDRQTADQIAYSSRLNDGRD